MDSKLKVILFFSIFLTLLTSITYAQSLTIGIGEAITVSVIRAVASWSNVANYTPPYYSNTTLSQFNVTWENANSVFIKIMNDTYVLVSNQSMNNIGGNVYNYSLILPAGSWKWISYANNSDNFWNSTGNITISISKGTPSVTLYINGSSTNQTVNLNSTINLTAVSISGLTVNLSLNAAGYNDSFQSNISPAVNLTNTSVLGIGVYNFSAQAIGNENYSNSSLGTLYFYVANFSASFSSPATYAPSQIYNFSIRLPVNVSNVYFEANFNGSYVNYTGITNVTNWNSNVTMFNDTSGNYWINFTDLKATTYNYMWIINDTSDGLFFTSWQNYVISQKSTSISSFTIDSPAFPGDSVLTSCSIYPSVNLSIAILDSVGNTLYSVTGSSLSHYITAPSVVATYTYTCNVTSSNENYTGSSTTRTLIVAQMVANNLNLGSSNSNQSSSGSFIITPSDSSVTIEPSSSKVIALTLSNTYSSDILNINITVSGLNSSWYTLNQTSISRLQNTIGVSAVGLTLNVPSDAETKNYTIIVSASGIDFSGNSLTIQRIITLIVPQEAPQNNTEEVANTTANTPTITVTETNAWLTGFSLGSESLRDIILLFGFIAAGLIFVFRNNVTEFLMKGHKPVAHEEKPESKKVSIFSSIKNKIHSLSEHKLVIQVKKKEKEKDKA